MRLATRIPLHRQPPVWLIACVVVASLSPVVLRAFGVEIGPPLPGEPARIAQAHEPAIVPPVVELEARTPVLARFEAAETEAASMRSQGEPELVIVDEDAAEIEAAHDDAASDESPAPAVVAEAGRHDAITDATPRASHPVARPTGIAEAKAACRRGNKDVARSVYRDLPVGDARRKEIRRACRQEGVWIL